MIGILGLARLKTLARGVLGTNPLGATRPKDWWPGSNHFGTIWQSL
jgi:hypothetical protein